MSRAHVIILCLAERQNDLPDDDDYGCGWDKINRPINARFDAIRHPIHTRTHSLRRKGEGSERAKKK